MKNFFVIALLFALSFSVSAGENKQKITLGVWENIQEDHSVEKIVEWIKPFYEAGITDFYMCGSPEGTARFIEASKKYRGVKVHAWIHVMNAPGDTVAAQHPEWFDVNRLGYNSLEYDPYVKHYKWLSPSHPQAREYVKQKVARYADLEGLESVHLDYIRYCDVLLGRSHQRNKFKMQQETFRAEYDFGYNPAALEKYKSIFGYSPLDIPAPWLTPEWIQFRLNEITSLVNEIVEESHAAGKLVSAAVFPFPLRARMTVYQDWPSWNIDIACPMNYQNDFEEGVEWVGFSVENGIRETRHRMRYISGLFVGRITCEKLFEAAELSIKAGADGINFFNARALLRDDKMSVVKKLREKYNSSK